MDTYGVIPQATPLYAVMRDDDDDNAPHLVLVTGWVVRKVFDDPDALLTAPVCVVLNEPEFCGGYKSGDDTKAYTFFTVYTEALAAYEDEKVRDAGFNG